MHHTLRLPKDGRDINKWVDRKLPCEVTSPAAGLAAASRDGGVGDDQHEWGCGNDYSCALRALPGACRAFQADTVAKQS